MSSRFKVRSGATTPRDRTEDDSLLTQGDVTSSITSSVPPVAAAAAQHSGRGLQSSLGHSGFSQSSSVRIHSVPHTSITAIPLAAGHASRNARATTAASSTAAVTLGNTTSSGPNTTGNTAAEVGGGGGGGGAGSRQSSRATTPSHSRPVSPSPALSARGKPTPLPERPSRPETPSPSEAAEIFDAHVKGADDKKPPTVSPTTHTLDQESPAPNTESETKDDTTSMAQTLISDRSPHTPPSHRRESRTPPASRVPGRRAAAPRTPALPSMRHLRSNSASTAASHLGASHLGASYLGTPRVGVPATKVSPSDKSARPPVPPMSRAMSRMGSPRVQERGASFAVGSDSSANVSPSVSPGSRSRPLIPNVFLPADADDSSKDDKHETMSHQDDPHSQQHDGSQSHRLSDSRREKEKERDKVTPTVAATHRDSRASRHFSDATLDDDDDRQRRRSAAHTAPQNASEGDLVPSTSVGSIGRTGPQSTARPEDIRSRSHGSSSSKSPDRDHRRPSVSAGHHEQSQNRDRKGERWDRRSGGSHSPGSPGHGRHSGPRRRSAASTISGAAAVPLGDPAAESSSAFHDPTDDDSPHQTAGKDSVLSSLLPSRRRGGGGGGGGGHTFPAAPGPATTRGDRGENESAEAQPALGSVALDSGRFAAQGSGSFRRPSMNPSASSSSYFESAPTSGLRRERPTHLTVPANTVPVHDHHKDRLGVASVAGISGVSGSKDYRSSSSRLNSPPALRPAMPGSHSREPSRGAESTSASMAASPATPASRGLGASDRSVMSRHSSVPSNYASATGAAALDSGASQARSEREGGSHHSYSHSQSQSQGQSQSQSLSRSNIRLPTSTSPGNRHEEEGDDDDGMLSALLPSSYKPAGAQPSPGRHQNDSLAGTQNTQASARTSGQNKLLGSRSFLAAAAAATPLTTMSSDRNQTVLSGLTSPRSDDPLAADFVSLNTTAVRSSQPPLDQFQQQQFQPQPHQHRTGRTDEHLSATVTSASVSANSASGDGHPAALRESMRGRSILGLVDTPLTTNRPNGGLPARGGLAQQGPGVSTEETDRTTDEQQHRMGGHGSRSPQTRIFPPAFDTDTDDDMARRSLPGSPSQPLMTHPLGLRVHSPTKLFSSADVSGARTMSQLALGHQESRVVTLRQNGGVKSSADGQEGDQEFSVVEVCFAVPALSYSRYLTTRPAAIAKGVASDIEHECGPLLDVENKTTESPTAQTTKSPSAPQFAEHYDEDEDDAIASMFMTASQLHKSQISHSDRLHDNGGRGRDRGAGAGDRKLKKEEADSTPPSQPPLSTVRAKIESAAAVFSVDQMEAWLRLREEGVTAAVRRYAGADLDHDAVDRRHGATDRDHNPHKHHHQRPQEEVIDEAVLDVVDEVVATKKELIDWVAVVAYITCPASSRDAIAAHLREMFEDASKENAVSLKSYIQSSDTLSSLLRSQRRGSNAGFHDVGTVASTPAPILPSLRQMAGLQRPDATIAPSLWRVDGVGPVEEFHELERVRHVRAKQGQRLLREKVKALEEREAAQTNNNASAAVQHRIAHEPHGRHDPGASTKKQNDSRADATSAARGKTTFEDRDHHVDASRDGHHHHPHHHPRRAEKSPDRRVQVASTKPPVHSSMHSGPSSVRDTPMRGPTSMSKESQPTPSRELLSLMDQLRPRRRSSTSADRSPDHRPNDSVSARPAFLNRDSANTDSSSAGQLSNDFASRPTREHRDIDVAITRRVEAVMNGSSTSSAHSRHHAGAAGDNDGTIGARIAAGAFRGTHRDPTSEEVAPRGASPQPHGRRRHMADAEADAKGVGLPSPFPPSHSPLPPTRRQESPSRTSFNENAGDNAGKPQPEESSKSKEGPSALNERHRRPQGSLHDASVITNATSCSVAASADGLIAVQLETMLTEIDEDLFTKQGTIDADFTATAHKTACRDLFDACGSGAVNRPSDVGVRLSSVPFRTAKRKTTKTSKTATITDDFSFDPVSADSQRGSKQNTEQAEKESDADVVNVVKVTAVLECEPRFKTAMLESVTKQLKSDDAFIKLKLLCVHQLDCEFVYGVDAAHTVLDGRTLE